PDGCWPVAGPERAPLLTFSDLADTYREKLLVNVGWQPNCRSACMGPVRKPQRRAWVLFGRALRAHCGVSLRSVSASGLTATRQGPASGPPAAPHPPRRVAGLVARQRGLPRRAPCSTSSISG